MDFQTAPNSPSELFAMQQSVGIREEINGEGVAALRDYLVEEVLPELNPNMSQVLVLVKRLVEDLESYHLDVIESGDLDERGRKIWKRDCKNITRALMALRQVAEF